MRFIHSYRLQLFAVAGALAVLSGWSTVSEAQTVSGQGSAVRAAVQGLGTALADTGTLGGSRDAREASQPTVSIPSLLTGEVLHATTIGYPGEVDSEASLGNLNMTVAGYSISADLVMARALAVLGRAGTGVTNMAGLTIGGVPVIPTGTPNQTLSLAGLNIVLNEQIPSPGSMIVNALHVRSLDGLTDVVIGTAKAAITPK